MKKFFLLCLLSAGMLWGCNNSSKEKTETKDTTVMPAPVTPPDTTNHGGDTTGKGEQAPPPKMN